MAVERPSTVSLHPRAAITFAILDILTLSHHSGGRECDGAGGAVSPGAPAYDSAGGAKSAGGAESQGASAYGNAGGAKSARCAESQRGRECESTCGAKSPLSVVLTISLLGMISLRRPLALGRVEAYQHVVPSWPGALKVQDGHPSGWFCSTAEADVKQEASCSLAAGGCFPLSDTVCGGLAPRGSMSQA